jgi:hypothetical protein
MFLCLFTSIFCVRNAVAGREITVNENICVDTSRSVMVTKYWKSLIVRGPFAKFVDSPHYSESELCGGAVTVFFWSTSLGKRSASYNAPPTSRKRAADRWSFRNFLPQSCLFTVGKAQKLHMARSELNSVFGLKKVDRWNPIRTSAIHSRSRPMRFLGFSNHENGAPRQEIS